MAYGNETYGDEEYGGEESGNQTVTAESTEELIRALTSAAGENSTSMYLKWASLSATGDDNLEAAVRRKLVANSKSSQIRENLLSTIKAGGGVGESVEACLRNTGLVGFS